MMTTASLHFGGWRLRQARVRLLRYWSMRGRMPECARCGRVIDPSLSGLHPDGATVGHRVPVSHGGDDSYENLALEHRRCNLAAGARVAPPRASVVEPITVPSGDGRGVYETTGWYTVDGTRVRISHRETLT